MEALEKTKSSECLVDKICCLSFIGYQYLKYSQHALQADEACKDIRTF